MKPGDLVRVLKDSASTADFVSGPIRSKLIGKILKVRNINLNNLNLTVGLEVGRGTCYFSYDDLELVYESD